MIDYKRKYLKYKMKYLNLLGGESKKFSVIRNNGSNGTNRYSNQCFWISICQYLNKVLDNDINLEELRNIASPQNSNIPINNETQEFDTTEYFSALQNIIETFSLQIHMYITYRDSSNQLVINNEPNYIVGELFNTNIISIVSYGSHFELITHIGSRQLYPNIKESELFIPNKELALGKKMSYYKNKSSNNKNEKEIEELLDLNTLFNVNIATLQQSIKKYKNMISTLENEFYKENKNDYDSELVISMIQSMEERKEFFKKEIEKFESELILVENNKNEIKKRLDELF